MILFPPGDFAHFFQSLVQIVVPKNIRARSSDGSCNLVFRYCILQTYIGTLGECLYVFGVGAIIPVVPSTQALDMAPLLSRVSF